MMKQRALYTARIDVGNQSDRGEGNRENGSTHELM